MTAAPATADTATVVVPTPDTVHWGYLDGSLPFAARIPDGGLLRVRTIQGHPDDDPVPASWIADDVRTVRAVIEQGHGPHIITGPVEVEGAEPGQVLGVDLLEITLGARYGVNRIRPGRGLLPDVLQPDEPADIAAVVFDAAGRTGRVQPGIDLPLRPFFGILATAPPRAWGRVTSVEPGPMGGNMDCRELTAGTRVYLPVYEPGAGLSVGDGHAAQGDGEVDQTAIETCLDGLLRAWVEPHLTLDGPVAVTGDALVVLAAETTLDEAARTATSRLLALLEVHCGLPRRDGYRLASLGMDLRITQVVNGVRGVHAVLPHHLLAQLDPPAWLEPPTPDGARPLQTVPLAGEVR